MRPEQPNRTRAERRPRSPETGEREKLVLHTLRHGPTNYNLEGRMQGNQQSRIVPESIRPYLERVGAERIPQPELIVITGLIRTRETAEALVAYRGWPSDIPIIEHSELNERKWGIFEGHTKAEVQAILGERDDILIPPPLTLEQVRAMDDIQPLIDLWDFKPPEAESMWEVQVRIREALQKLRQRYAGKEVLWIGHLGALASQGIEAHRVSRVEVGVDARGELKLLVEPEAAHT